MTCFLFEYFVKCKLFLKLKVQHHYCSLQRIIKIQNSQKIKQT